MAKQKTLEESIQKFIVDRVREHWDDFQRAYLLSNMGYAIKREFAESAVAMPKGLKDFLRQWPIVAEVSYPGIAEKVGLVPLGVELPEDIRVLFKPKDVRDEKTPVYEDAFWDAFINPITKNDTYRLI
ncbi:hypothetical protein LP421_15990 [Rhizobium sp. RCAM05350]|nr:hypothetical protein LP421_15990 [Rhizobium sp. RCAM05350]